MLPLTDKQMLVMMLLSEGKTAKQVGKKLGRSPSTINHCVDAVAKKMNLPNRNLRQMIFILNNETRLTA